jgi:DNA polymerase-3 subunit gamma/tau
MAPAGIVTHLESILAQEQISFELPALRLLAQGAQGSMRDALSLTDQAIAYAAGQVTLDAVQGMLGALDHSYLVGLLDALSAQDGVALLAVADDMGTRSLSFNNALQDLGTLLNRIAIAQTVPAAIPDELPEREDILRLASVFTPEDVQLCYQIVVHGRNELGLAPDEYAGFTMTLLRMLAFSPVSSAATPGGAQGHTAQGHASPQAAPRVAPLASTAKQAAAPFPSTRAAPVESSAKNTTPDKKPVGPAMAALAAARGGKSAAKAVAPQDDFLSEPAADLPVHDSAEGDTAQKKTEQPAEIVTTSPENVSAPALVGAIDWPTLVGQLPLKGVAQQLATQSELLGSEDAEQVRTMKLRVPVETLLSAGSADKLAAALSSYFEKTVRLETEIGNVTRTAHAASVAEQARRQQLAEQTLNDDPFVQTLIREFGATIVPGSVKPV